MFLVLGSIIAGIATVTEASGVGALSAMILAAFYRKLNLSMLKEAFTALSIPWAIFSAS